MTTLILVMLFGGLAIVLAEGNWRAGLMVTLVIGFLQDPLRKLTPDQPSVMAGLVLVAFALTTLVLYSQRNNMNLRAMFWMVPQMQQWGPMYVVLIVLQSFNSFLRFGDITLTAIGAAFYLAPILALWMGFQVGCDQALLRRLITIYLAGSLIFAASVFIGYRGYEHPLLKEVGQGIFIWFRYGFGAQGASGFWRTSEIASWQLSAASCLSASFGLSSKKSSTQIILLLMAVVFAFCTILTGRRKALILIYAFVAIFLLLFSRRATASSKERLISSVLGVAGLAYVGSALFFANALGENFGEYWARMATGPGEVTKRFQGQGLGAIARGLEISDGMGLGVGVGAQTGNFKVTAYRASIANLGFASEGGGGRVTLELGLPGLIILAILALLLFLTLRRNYRLLKFLPQSTAILMTGLLSFVLANGPAFLSAGQLYNDPFVLMLIGLCLGSFLAIPTLLAQQQQLQQQLQRQQQFQLQQAALRQQSRQPGEQQPLAGT